MKATFEQGYKVKSSVWTKKNFQEVLRAIRKTPDHYDIKKLDSGYEVRNPEGHMMIKAMNGRNGYLVRMVVGFIT